MKRSVVLNRDQKIAIARIVSDLIEADFIVEEKEMNFYEKFISEELKINEQMLVDAKRTDMAKAVSILKELDLEKRKIIVERLKELALSDGTCVPLEAIQIFAIDQAMEHNAYIYSVPSLEIGINNMTVIYIENSSHNKVNLEIERNYRSIRNDFALAGFDFVYIPYVVNDYKNMRTDYLKKVVRYMLPSVPGKKVESICHKLQNMTTSRFCRDLLYKKNGIPITDAKPSLLIKINESALINQFEREDAERVTFANFLLVELKVDILNQIRTIIDSYHRMVNCPITVSSAPESPKFMYYGFHRSLFDLIAYEHEQKEFKLIFDLSKPHANIYFEALDESKETIPIKLNPQETCLYVMIVKKSLTGAGLDWRDEPPKDIKKEILEEYNKIYRRIGKLRTTRVYKDRIQVHNIKNRILANKTVVANLDKFMPMHVKDGGISYYVVKAPEDSIVIKVPIDL